MRTILVAATLAVSTLAGVDSGDAQSRGPKPWCIAGGAFGPNTLDCTYWTFKQCTESARGAGGYCVENPELLWERRGWPTQRQRPSR